MGGTAAISASRFWAAIVTFCTLLAVPARAQFETRSSSGTATTPIAVVAADFNHDGKIDFATGSLTDPEVQVFLGNGNGTFRAPAAYDVGLGTGPLVAADLDGDGNVDLVVVNGACPNDVCDDSVAVLIGNGDGTFQPPVYYATPPGPYGVVVGDFNGDGKLDIATANKNDYTSVCACVGVLLGNGDGTFQEPAIVTSLGQYPWAVAASHFTNGKNLDLAVTFSLPSSGEVQILWEMGTGHFSWEQITPSHPSPYRSPPLTSGTTTGPISLSASSGVWASRSCWATATGPSSGQSFTKPVPRLASPLLT
ncbi:MAG TPA: VCBS repeat-containing protein [Candidatus Sulfotelmatobacter sp.]